MKKNILFLISTILFSYLSVEGQVSFGGQPLTFGSNALRIKATINRKEFQYIDNAAEKGIADKIAIENGYDLGKLYGKSIIVDIDFKKEATVQILGDTAKLYLLELTSPSAFYLQVFFDLFELPEGAKLFFYDKDQSMFLGSFDQRNNFINKTFWTQFIKGNTVIIEYYEPNNMNTITKLHISKLSHVFDNFTHGPFSVYDPVTGTWGAEDCNVNVNCPTGYGWDREKRSVAIILGEFNYPGYPTPYIGWCSGALLNNTSQDGRPLLLTAQHCMDPQGGIPPQMEDPWNWLFLFNHETTNCDDLGSTVNSSMMQSVYGALVRSKDGFGSPTSDYLLLELNVSAAILASYNVVYAGWDINPNKALNSPYTIAIHHPMGDVKKIAKDNSSPFLQSYNGLPSIYHWGVIYNQGVDQGIVQHGSSGCPLFNNEHKIIGQLHGGNCSCSFLSSSALFGNFSQSYSLGGFSFYLDPWSTHTTTLGSYNPSEINEHCYNGVLDGGESGIDCGGSCPPCSWVNTYGWGSTTCNNGIKDGDETGIDCGGNCAPCGGTLQCSDCIKNGDETNIDCGGSCVPCRNGCTTINKVYTNNNNLPAYTTASEYIEAGTNVSVLSGQMINFQALTYIKLKSGFSVKAGGYFKAVIAPCDCKQICVKYPTLVTNGNLCYDVSSANRYTILVKDRWGTTKLSTSGNINNFGINCIWDCSGLDDGAYYVTITFYNDCSGESKTINHSIAKLSQANQSDYGNILNTNMENAETYNKIQPRPAIKIYPNPANTQVIIDNPSPYKSKLTIYDLSNKIVESNIDIMLGINTIDISQLSNGFYILKIVSPDYIYFDKIVKN